MPDCLTGLWDILFERRLSGKCIVALDASCSFMGINPQQGDDTAMYPTFMPYIVRSGGGDDGWLDLYTSAKLIAGDTLNCALYISKAPLHIRS